MNDILTIIVGVLLLACLLGWVGFMLYKVNCRYSITTTPFKHSANKRFMFRRNAYAHFTKVCESNKFAFVILHHGYRIIDEWAYVAGMTYKGGIWKAQ